jgi:hypothetical protein
MMETAMGFEVNWIGLKLVKGHGLSHSISKGKTPEAHHAFFGSPNSEARKLSPAERRKESPGVEAVGSHGSTFRIPPSRMADNIDRATCLASLYGWVLKTENSS